jgi:hypothetical protein
LVRRWPHTLTAGVQTKTAKASGHDERPLSPGADAMMTDAELEGVRERANQLWLLPTGKPAEARWDTKQQAADTTALFAEVEAGMAVVRAAKEMQAVHAGSAYTWDGSCQCCICAVLAAYEGKAE